MSRVNVMRTRKLALNPVGECVTDVHTTCSSIFFKKTLSNLAIFADP